MSSAALAENAQALSKDADAALHSLTSNNKKAADIAAKAKAVLIFPFIVKAGVIFGGAYGEGVLKQTGIADSYYNSVTALYGVVLGAQYYGYAVFLMNDKAVDYVRATHGFELGVGPGVVFVNLGIAKNLSTTSLKEDAYAFIFDQAGLMANLSIEGTKITPISK